MKNPLPEMPIDELEFLAVDVETTGLSASAGDRICEIGAVKLRGMQMVESYGTLVNPLRPISPGASAVNRITDEMVADAPPFPAVARRLAGMMRNVILLGYNLPFDLSFLRTELRSAGLPPPANPVIDALALARQLLPGLQRYPQDNVAAIVGISRAVRHRALEDAKTTAALFILFASMVKAHGYHTLADLQRGDLRMLLHDKRLSIIRHAQEHKSDLWIRYLSPRNNQISDRVVTPVECHTLESPGGGAAQMIAYCHSVGAQRNFRVDRILDLRLVHPFTPTA